MGEIRGMNSRHKSTASDAIDRKSSQAYNRRNTSMLMENILEYATTDIEVV